MKEITLENVVGNTENYYCDICDARDPYHLYTIDSFYICGNCRDKFLKLLEILGLIKIK